MRPATRKTHVRGPLAWMHARSEPPPLSLRLVTSITAPPRPPTLDAPPPCAPGNAAMFFGFFDGSGSGVGSGVGGRRRSGRWCRRWIWRRRSDGHRGLPHPSRSTARELNIPKNCAAAIHRTSLHRAGRSARLSSGERRHAIRARHRVPHIRLLKRRDRRADRKRQCRRRRSRCWRRGRIWRSRDRSAPAHVDHRHRARRRKRHAASRRRDDLKRNRHAHRSVRRRRSTPLSSLPVPRSMLSMEFAPRLARHAESQKSQTELPARCAESSLS